MPAITFGFPILPGKEGTDRQWMDECAGPRREQFLSSRQRMGVSREVAWHQSTPQGTLKLVYLEADDPQRLVEVLSASDDPFDQWFREKAMEVHGLDLSQPLPGGLPQMVFDGPLP